MAKLKFCTRQFQTLMSTLYYASIFLMFQQFAYVWTVVYLILTLAKAQPKHPLISGESEVKTSTESTLSSLVIKSSSTESTASTIKTTPTPMKTTASTIKSTQKVAADLFKASFRPRRPTNNPLLYYHILSGF